MAFLDLFRRASFSHGIHPPYHKEDTASVNIRRMPFADVLVLPLDQHIGKPARAIVQKGQEVARGELIAEADGFVSAPIYAPATGRIKGIGLMPTAKGPKAPAILLEVSHAATQEVLWGNPADVSDLSSPVSLPSPWARPCSADWA